MTEQLRALDQLGPQYKAVFCDVWGVVHNGVELYPGAASALASLMQAGIRVILVTNAPRPAELVVQQLNGFGLDDRHFDAVATSGDATQTLIAKFSGQPVYHLGPARDLSLYDGLGVLLSDIEDAVVVSCTGFFDDQVEQPDDYRSPFAGMIKRGLPMICSNPDIVIDRGGQKVWCAGALANLYRQMGGEVELAGKPYWPIYHRAAELLRDAAGRDIGKDEILAIGDGLKTDVLGAQNYGIDCLLVTDGIHAQELGGHGTPTLADVTRTLGEEGVQARYFIANLKAGL